MFNNPRRTVLFFAALALALAVRAEVTNAQGPTDKIAACIEGAASDFANCVDDHAWYVAPLCAARYASDSILCTGHAI